MKIWGLVLGVSFFMAIFFATGVRGEAQEAASPQVLRVSLDEWRIDISEPNLLAGPITFQAENRGKLPHELVVIRTDIPAQDFQVKDGKVKESAVGTVLKNHGIKRALVSCGSTLFAYGRPHWPIGIQHPRKPNDEMARLDLSEYALATSGDYERCYVCEGQRYSHLIDPRTGFPVSGMASVSVIAKTALEADALSTAAFVLGVDAGRDLLEMESDVAGYLVSEGQKGALSFHATKGWTDFLGARVFPRRRFLKLASIVAMGVILPGGWMRPRPSQAAAIRFATEKEALARMMPEAENFSQDAIHLNDKQLEKAQQLTGKGFRKKTYDFWVGHKGDQAIAYALKLNVVGKKRPITFF